MDVEKNPCCFLSKYIWMHSTGRLEINEEWHTHFGVFIYPLSKKRRRGYFGRRTLRFAILSVLQYSSTSELGLGTAHNIWYWYSEYSVYKKSIFIYIRMCDIIVFSVEQGSHEDRVAYAHFTVYTYIHIHLMVLSAWNLRLETIGIRTLDFCR